MAQQIMEAPTVCLTPSRLEVQERAPSEPGAMVGLLLGVKSLATVKKITCDYKKITCDYKKITCDYLLLTLLTIDLKML